MSLASERISRESYLEELLRADPNLAAALVLAAGFLVRVWAASGTFLNPDEALHLLIAHGNSLARAYQASLTTAHPPLFILVLYLWRALGNSEFVLRLPSVIAGTVFGWMVFKWMSYTFGQTAGWIALVLTAFLPPLIALSSEVRQYALLLCFLATATYFLERALTDNSASKMSLSFLFLYFALLTHYSAVLFAGVIAGYFLPRLTARRFPAGVIVTWAVGQAGALGIFLALYFTHLSKLGDRASQSAIHGFASDSYLRTSYFHPGHDNRLLFVLGRSFGVFQFVFGQLAVGDIAGLIFIVGAVLLLRGKTPPQKTGPASRQLGILLLLPFVLTCGAAMMDRQVPLWWDAPLGVPNSFRCGRGQLRVGETRRPTNWGWTRRRHSDCHCVPPVRRSSSAVYASSRSEQYPHEPRSRLRPAESFNRRRGLPGFSKQFSVQLLFLP